MSGLPHGWAAATIPDLVGPDGVFSDGDWVESKDQDPDGDVRLTQLADVGDGVFRNRSARYLKRSRAADLRCTYLELGDVLVARMPDPLGRACLFPGVGQPAITAVDVCVIRPGSVGVDPRWLMWTINAPTTRREILARQAGTTRKRIARKNLGTIVLPVPPLPEQRRIVAAIDEHLSCLDDANASLKRCDRRLATLRREALSAALPSEAPLARLGDVAAVAGGHTPKGLPSGLAGPIPFYKVGDMNLSDGALMGRSRTYLDEAAARELKVRLWPRGTVILPKQGGAIATNKKRMLTTEAACDLNTMGVIPSNGLDSGYLLAWFESVELTNLSDGSVVAQIRPSRVADLSIPLPALDEQRRIVRRIEEATTALDALRAAIDRAQHRAGSLRRAILERAFSGELVPQDPSDEPASVLLERIREERAASPSPPRRRRVSA